MVHAPTQTKNWRKPRPLGECRKTPKRVSDSLNAIAEHFIRLISPAAFASSPRCAA